MNGGVARCVGYWIPRVLFNPYNEVIPLEHERYFEHANVHRKWHKKKILNAESRPWRPKGVDGRLLYP